MESGSTQDGNRAGRERDGDEPNAGFTCLVMQDDWGVLGACVYVDVGRRKGRRDKKVMRGADMDGSSYTLREGTESLLISSLVYAPPPPPPTFHK